MRDHFRPFPRPIAVATAAGVLLAAVAHGAGTALAAGDPAEVAPTAEAVSKYLQQQDYRKNWKFFPGKQAFYKGVVPHGAVLTTYVNAPALKGLQTSGRLPVGSMIVMENYSPDRKLESITVMVKAAGFDPQHNDWFWMKRLADDDRAVSAGMVLGCIACHGTSTEDYIMTPRT